jgi:prepilin-type N-terminal cleavage/methylation domain-containing protein/prepilin-type processing-associated H-X9-DG protein
MNKHDITTVRSGFTLTELLVSMAIISVMLGLLVPALATAREHGRRAKCLSNMRQLAMGMTMAADENNGYLPSYLYDLQANSTDDGVVYYKLVVKSGWSMADTGPLANPDILLCPSDKNPSLISTTDKDGHPITIASSYGFNIEVLFHNTPIHHMNLANLILLYDGKPDKATDGFWVGNSDATGSETAWTDSDTDVSLTSSVLKPGGGPPGGGPPGGGPPGGGKDKDCDMTVCDTVGNVMICHVPPGNPDNAQSIIVNSSSCYAHVCHQEDLWNQPCAGHDLKRLNSQVVDRRHSGRINVIFLDGRGEWLHSLPADSIFP